MRTPIVAGNWKMNGSQAMAGALCAELVENASKLSGLDIIVCPPATLLGLVSKAVGASGIRVGAQDIDPNPSGAYTGQQSAALVADAGASHSIIGHSERRTLFAETDTLIADKTRAALATRLTPILCVGETRQQREADETSQVVEQQLDAVIDAVGITEFSNIVIAYEPVWAIGTGLTASPEQAQAVHAHIRAHLARLDSETAAACRIIYGGSMKPDNAAALVAEPDIDGGLIGGASLEAEPFLSICRAAVRNLNQVAD